MNEVRTRSTATGEKNTQAANGDKALMQQISLEGLMCTEVLAQLKGGIIIADAKGHIVSYNTRADDILRLSPLSKADLCLEQVFGNLKYLLSLVERRIVIENFVLPHEALAECGEERNYYISARPLPACKTIAGSTIILITDAPQHKTAGGRPCTPPPHRFSAILTSNAQMRQAKEHAVILAPTRTRILIQSEVGTGKQVFAESIHNACNPSSPFITCNCSVIAATPSVKSLVGCDGPKNSTPGLFEMADGGTLFLDNVDELPLDYQALVVRVLDDNFLTRLGSVEKRPVDFRLICSTSINLEEQMLAGNFRRDFYYRIATDTIIIPPLRNRPEDIPALALSFALEYCKSHKLPAKILNQNAAELLSQLPWPGNVRQLRSAINTACSNCTSNELSADDFASCLNEMPDKAYKMPCKRTETVSMREAEKEQIVDAIRDAQGNMAQAAKALSISRSTLYKRAAQYGIKRDAN